jgi:hypothetical protein
MCLYVLRSVLWSLLRFLQSKRCSVHLYLQLFVGGLMPYLRYLSLLEYSGIKHILCCVFALFFSVLCILKCLFFLDCPYFIASSVFSNVYVSLNCLLPAFVIVYFICYLTLNTSAHTSYLYDCTWARTHHFFRNACTKSGSLRFSQVSGCWLILSVYILMIFDFPFVRLFGVWLLPLFILAYVRLQVFNWPNVLYKKISNKPHQELPKRSSDTKRCNPTFLQ